MARSSTTAGKSGVYWFPGRGPDDFAAKFSIVADQLPGKAEAIVNAIVERGAERMDDILQSGGINKTAKGGAREITGDMRSSINSRVSRNANGRIQGDFGFIDNAPFYTKFQERGTVSQGPTRGMAGPRQKNVGGGIAPMLAYATALEEAIVDLQNQISSTQWFASSSLSQVARPK